MEILSGAGRWRRRGSQCTRKGVTGGSDCESADARLVADECVTVPIQAFVRGVMIFAERPKSLLAGPSINGQIDPGNIGVAQQFGALVFRRDAEQLRPGAFRPVGSFKRGNLLLGNFKLPYDN